MMEEGTGRLKSSNAHGCGMHVRQRYTIQPPATKPMMVRLVG